MSISLSKILLGRRISNREFHAEKVGILRGVPAMGLDGLGSVAYGPEAMLTVLVVAGSAGLCAAIGIAIVIVLLLAMLYFSYRQTIAAYPTNGGSYVVAKQNLGSNLGLLAASALMIDYLLNVAVGISAGVGALTSAIPQLHPYTLSLCILILIALTVANLRGTRESSSVFALPTYAFIASVATMLGMAVAATWLSNGHPQPVVPPPPIPPAVEAIGVWLILRAFASGCTAMTGVEAVSNGISAFSEPRVRTAHRTLTVIVVTLGIFLLALALATRSYGVMAMDQSKDGYQSVISQLTAVVFGRDWPYYVTMAAVLSVLCISANTSFVGFPRLCHTVATDGYLPSPFAVPGRRLVYSAGITFLAVGAGTMLTLFDGITDRLIPLFALGAFLSFTLSQAGMAVHWLHVRRSHQEIAHQHDDGRQRTATGARLAINATGAMATGAALAVILVAKFAEGAWIVLIAIPATLIVLKSCKRYNAELDRRMLRGSHTRIDVRDHVPPVAIVPIRRWDQLSRKAVEYALRLSPDVTALHITKLEGPDVNDEADRLKNNWHRFVDDPAREFGLKPPQLEIVRSEYRSVLMPLLKAVRTIDQREPKRPVLVVLPELVEGKWWGYLMHTHRERRLRAKLLRYSGPRISVATVPWQIQPLTPEQGLREEQES
jgi:amino acid transporter